jgi:hypothetical protein
MAILQTGCSGDLKTSKPSVASKTGPAIRPRIVGLSVTSASKATKVNCQVVAPCAIGFGKQTRGRTQYA